MIARLFRENADIEAFRQRVAALNGDFPFDRDDMIALGDVYFERYPDCFSNRNCQDVTLGYRMVRICVIEKLVRRCEPGSRAILRDLFGNAASLQAGIERLMRETGRQRALECHRMMEEELAAVQHVIDSLPVGMTKERFIGGVSYLHNALYLIKSAIDRAPRG
ncbi:MAG: hypothetical protein KBA15_11085 [Spirochaetes bacterium]|jgi:hypothetical protein|nr:hypothetical protein [Spirochaetota bacterium]